MSPDDHSNVVDDVSCTACTACTAYLLLNWLNCCCEDGNRNCDLRLKSNPSCEAGDPLLPVHRFWQL